MPAPEQEASWIDGSAVVWLKSGYGDDGSPTVSAPIQIAISFSRKQRLIKGDKGELIAIDATARVSGEVEIGSIIWLGSLAEFNAMTEDEQAVAGYYEVVNNSVVKDIKGREVSYKIMLSRHSESSWGVVVA